MSPDDKAKQKNLHSKSSNPWDQGREELGLSFDLALHEGLRQTEQALQSATEDILRRVRRDVERQNLRAEEEKGPSRAELEADLKNLREELDRSGTERERWAETREQLAEAETEMISLTETMEVGKTETLRTLEESKAEREALAATLKARESELAESQRSLAESADQLREKRSELSVALEALASREAELEAANESRGDAADSKSDPLLLKGRTIEKSLFGLSRASGMLGKTFLDPEQERFIGKIKARATELTGSIGAILALRLMDQGELEIELEPISPAALLQDLIELHAEGAIAKSLHLKTEIAADCPEEVLADGDHLTLVLSCLLENAIHCASSGSITLGLGAEEGLLRFFVSDQGSGIPEDLAELIQTGDLENATAPPGAGLGLPLAARLLREMESRLRLESQAGKGTRFEFDLAVESRVLVDA